MTAHPHFKQLPPSLQRSATHAFAPVQREFNRLFDRLVAGWEDFTEFELSPRMEIQESRDAVELPVELPGMTRDEVKIDIHDDVLTVSGEKRAEKEVKEDNYRLSERSYGAFSRSITLPRSVDADKIKATMAEGVLKILAPKDGTAVAKTIEIQSAKYLC